MNIQRYLKIIAILIPSILLSIPAISFAAELDSTNFKIVGATTQGGGIVESTSGNYSALLNVGSISSDPRIYSTLYKVGSSPETPFLPSAPIISCFDATSTSHSECSIGSSGISSAGMTSLCGDGGCYDKARFELSDYPYHYQTNDSRLVSYWPMDELANDTCAGGQDVCDLKSSNHGTDYGAGITTGRFARGREFTGGTDYLDMGNNSSLDLTSQGTISVWVKSDRTYPSDDATTKFRWILYKTNGGGVGEQSYWFDWYGTNTSRTFRARISNAAGASNGFSISNYDMGTEWKHFVLTFDGSLVKLFINGTLYGSVTQTISAQVITAPVKIGGAYGWDGLIDEVMIYNQALSDSEVEALYQETALAVNPADTLYSVMISTDNFVSDIRYIDSSTFMPESISTHNLSDFMPEDNWEAELLNLKGLEPNTTYYLRAVALQGSFTQTEPGPVRSTTTGIPEVFFDIDIADESGYTAESSPPHSIQFTGAYELIGGSAAITAQNRIWLDGNTNSSGGYAIIMNGTNGGLYSPTTLQTITSATADLNGVSSGFGLQSEYIDYSTDGPTLGFISSTTDYSGTGNEVGIISTTANKIYDADGPIIDGRMALKVIAKPGTSYTAATDYSETIFLIFVPRY